MHFPTATPGPGRHVLPRRTWELLRDPAGRDVPLMGLLNHARPAYGSRRGSWNAAVQGLLSWPSEAAIVQGIADELRAGVRLEQPVHITTRRGERVVNGMHRIAAHILVEAPTILATTAVRVCPPDSELIAVHGTLEPIEGVEQVRSDWDDDLGFPFTAWEHLRSLRAGPVWATADGMGTFEGVTQLAYHAPHRHQDALLSAMARRAEDVGFQLQVDKVFLTRLNDDDIFGC